MNESDNLYQQVNTELIEARKELQRLSSENRRLREQVISPGSDSQEHRIEEAQALALAAETARHLAEEKNLELSHLVTESSHQIALLQSQARQSQEELQELREELAALRTRDSQEQEGGGDVSRAAFVRLQQQLSQLHATSKSKLEKMADDSRQRHQLWEQAQLRVNSLEEELSRQGTARQAEIADLRQKLETQLSENALLTNEKAKRLELEELLKRQGLQLSSVRGELEDYQLALETSEEQVRFLDEELEDREQIVDSLHAQIAAYLDKLRLAQGKLNTVGEAVQQRNTWLRQLQEQNRGLAAKSRNWEQLHEQANQQKLKLETELFKVTEEMEDVRWELEETQTSLEDSQNMVSNLQDQLHQQMPQARVQLQELQLKYEEARKRVKELESRLATRDSMEEETIMELPAVVVTEKEAD